MEWISVKDKLPDFEKQVLLYWKWKNKEGNEYESYETGYLVQVTARNSSLGITHYPDFRIRDSYDNSNPTHWIELTPPKL